MQRFHSIGVSPVIAGLALLLSLPAAAAPGDGDGVVRVGVYENAPKLMLGRDGRPSGILGDLLVEIAQREGWNLQPVPCRWQQCLEALERGTIDLMPDVAYSDQRALRFDFHRQPSLHSWSGLYARPGSGIHAPPDLNGRRLAVLSGAVQQQYLQGMLDSFGVEARLVEVESLAQGFELVASGDADAVVANRHYGDYVSLRYGLGSTPVMFQPARLYYATGKGRNGDLLATLDRYLADWVDNPASPYITILNRWGEPAASPVLPRSARRWLAGLAALLALALAGAALLRWQVARRTAQLTESQSRLETILNGVESAIYIKGQDLRYRYGNRRLCEMFGLDEPGLQGRSDEDFFSADAASEIRRCDTEVIEQGKRIVTEERLPMSDGSGERVFLTVKIPLRDALGRIYALCGISTDITEHKRNREEIHQLAFYDPLTELPNRRLLIDRLEHALATRTRTRCNGALLFIDLDNFKNLNDSLGHDMGDRLLQQVGERLKRHIRDSDTLARLGGDEFVLMLEGLAIAADEAARQVETLANKLLQLLAEPYTLPGKVYSSSASIGVAMFSDDFSSVDELLKRADLAMYQAKASGRNRVRFFNPKMQADVDARAELESDMREGLRREEFFLAYQPFVDAGGRLLGAEVLVRWRHPQRGLVSPAEFIPLAEDNGAILPLGSWILRGACRQLVAWSAQPAMAGLKLAVNISAKQLHHPDFVAEVLQVLDETGANPDRLELELTESHLVEDVEAMIGKMQRLRARGVHFSLDDFGTGYSSLSYLKRLPLDHLKIDQSFVRDLLTDCNDEAIVSMVIALGRSLDLAVIAEGVETEAQWRRLLELGCDQFQGYLFGHPGPVEALPASVGLTVAGERG
ncbi:hypothetical protein GCM10011348_05390 [Marinobacterium nitratireducens]|uniref:cyclic-guanylate-specific phosphodiesterase n=1 Tax=Marinobacterium nitratireducens TaxID=518897 RepID=A0A917Z730_9GAMM|nr:EAL domain-containing protein [Marinobacterium nitratireducens]GGO76956.1 hypothetical protein GCM10011348_05390 [Marinobacterium nitratireducens]